MHSVNASSPPAAARLDWVDVCKGLCIILVVYGHVVGGLEAAGSVPEGSIFDRLRSWVYLFHMPAFFFLSGLFASRALGRSFAVFLSGKAKTLVYPYVLWTGIYLVVQELLSRYANNPPDAGKAMQFLWAPYGYGLWFLYSLFLISLFFHLVKLTGLRSEAILILAILLRIAAGFDLFAFWPILNQTLLNFVFYAIGGLYFEAVFAFLATAKPRLLLFAGLLSLGLMTLVAYIFGYVDQQAGFAAALLGVAGAVSVARAAATSFCGGFFSFLGFYSLEIYLGHPLFSTASRAILSRCHVHDITLTVVSGLMAGLFVSLALALLCQKCAFPFLYRWPAAKRSPRVFAQPQPCATS